MTLTVGSLFSGIGGLDLGLERAGMQVIWQSEIDKYACQILKKHWTEVPNLGNIKEIDWSTVERPAVICGGYPCQPFSHAGKRLGERDPRHLWPDVHEAIRILRPDYAILENVPGHVVLGLSTVVGDLAEIGYDAEWTIVSAASMGASHIRERLFIVAYPHRVGLEKRRIAEPNEAQHTTTERGGAVLADTDHPRIRTPHNGDRRERSTDQPDRETRPLAEPSRRGADLPDDERKRDGQHRQPTETSIFSRCWDTDRRGKAWNVSREWWQSEPNVGRVAHGIPRRVDRLRGLGNAVVPQVAEFVGRLVIEHHRNR